MIIVCSLPDHRNVCESVKASHLISVVDPGFQPETPSCVKSHLKLGFDDIVDIKEENQIYRMPGLGSEQILPNHEHINKIIHFIETWDQSQPIVVHCWCGVSRSMATAIFIICKINPNKIESNVQYMRSIAPHANPNKLMVSMFENYLEVEGKINETFNKYPHTVTYDCSTNFAPVCIFKLSELKKI